MRRVGSVHARILLGACLLVHRCPARAWANGEECPHGKSRDHTVEEAAINGTILFRKNARMAKTMLKVDGFGRSANGNQAPRWERPSSTNVDFAPGVRLSADHRMGISYDFLWWRPAWQKTYRCSTGTSSSVHDTCEDCTDVSVASASPGILIGDGLNCWGSDGWRRVVHWNGVGTQSRFVNAIHLVCTERRINVGICVTTLKYGKLTTLWDEHFVRSTPTRYQQLSLPAEDRLDGFGTTACSDRSAIPRQANIVLDADPVGGHTFDLEFEAYFRGAEVKIAALVFTMPTPFALCEDHKVCLETLETSGEAGLLIRNNNQLQLHCLLSHSTVPLTDEQHHFISMARNSAGLRSSEVTTVCSKWVQCLRHGVGDSSHVELHEQRLVLLLTAAMPSKLNKETSSIAGGKQKDGGGPCDECVSPPLADPESWDCDCFANMMAKCASFRNSVDDYSDTECMRALMCSHPCVCPEFVETSCGVNTVANAIRQHPAFDSAASGLVQKRSKRIGTSDQMGVVAQVGTLNGTAPLAMFRERAFIGNVLLDSSQRNVARAGTLDGSLGGKGCI